MFYQYRNIQQLKLKLRNNQLGKNEQNLKSLRDFCKSFKICNIYI